MRADRQETKHVGLSWIEVLALLIAGRGGKDLLDDQEAPPLRKITLQTNTGAVRRLLQSAANLDPGDRRSCTALLLATSNDHDDLVAWLSAGRAPYPNFHQPRRVAE